MASSNAVYIEILEKRLKQINSQLQDLKSKKKSLFTLQKNIDIKIYSLTIEKEKLDTEIKEYTDRERLNDRVEDALNRYDSKFSDNNEKQREYSSIIAELKEIKKKTEGRQAKAVIDKKIKSYENKIENLKGKNVFIQGIQRTMMYPKYKKMIKKQTKISKAEGKVLYNQTRLNDNEVLKEAVIADTAKSNAGLLVYDIKGIFYKKSLQKAEKKLEKLKNPKHSILLEGARQMVVERKMRKEAKSSPTVSTPEGPVL